MTIAVQSLNSIEVPEWLNDSIPCGIKVMDEFINGEGIHPGQILTLSASRGTGKTTLLLQMLNGILKSSVHLNALYVSLEEPSFQLKKTANRLQVNENIGIVGDDCDITLDEFLKLMEQYKVVVLDSFSLLKGDTYLNDGEKMKILKDTAKANQTALFIILHQTKGGISRGSCDLEHLCDTVIDIERGDPETFGDEKVRILKMDKNRFGSCGQVILRLERNGWDFDNPVEAKSINEANKTENARNSAQARKPQELKDILAVANKMGRFAFSDINHLIPADDSAAIGRFSRHIKELEKYGKLIGIGRGPDRVWELVK